VPGPCWCDSSALDELLCEARRWPLRETGGALLGWRDDGESVIAAVLGPGPRARHGLRSFEPDAEWQNERGRRRYIESGRRIAYLGDWHSHPHGGGAPSDQDRETVDIIATDPAFRAPRPLYAIASKPWRRFRRRAWQLTIYEWIGKEFAPLDVQVCELWGWGGGRSGDR
jgi:integrative and conjugative element protein (TIGR02256 family)